MTGMKRAKLILVILVALGFFVGTPIFAKTLFNESVPLTATILNPCTEENVDLDGHIRVLINGNITPSGKAHLRIHLNAENVKGEGQTSGRLYQGAGAANLVIHDDISDLSPLIVNGVVNAFLFSQGAADDLIIKIRLHITITANGEVTACIASFEVECE